MRVHQIDVDDEVMAYLKSKAEPLIDTANSVLRRELLGRLHRLSERRPVGQPGVGLSSLPDISRPVFGLPQALRQILAVVQLTRNGARTRPEATATVAKQFGVETQTVLDKYCRQLGLTALAFDRLLDQAGLTDLRALLKRKFPEHCDLIDKSIGSRAAP